MSAQPDSVWFQPEEPEDLSGVDSRIRRHVLLLGIDVAVETRSALKSALSDLGSLFEKTDFLSDLKPRGRSMIDGADGTVLVGFTPRFFFGESRPGRDLLTKPTRFGLQCAAPACLKTPNIRGDDRCIGLSSVDAARRHEADLLLFIEADAIARLTALKRSLEMLAEFKTRFCEAGFRSSNGRNGLGYHEGLSNLSDRRETDYGKYLGYITCSREIDRRNGYAGGTYLVYRKYQYNLDRWASADFEVLTPEGVSLKGANARDAIIGRQQTTGNFVDACGKALSDSVGEADAVARLSRFAHLRHANPRQIALTQFGDTVHPRDARILRRSAEYEIDGHTAGLLFLCFQSDIQKRGFEFINNNWLMSEGFLGCRDYLMSPESGLIMPLGGCYSFVPAADGFPGAQFF